MRAVRTAAAVTGAVIIGALLGATPSQAAQIAPPGPNQPGFNQPGGNQSGLNQVGGKVRVTVTAGVCGTPSARTATMRMVVPAQAVGAGPYTATATVNHMVVGRVQSLGTTPRFKRVTFAEDSYRGLARVLVVVTGGKPSMRPAPSVTLVDTDCRPPARPRVTSTGPTCRNRNMVVTVTNPAVPPAWGVVQVKVGLSRPKMLHAGQSTSVTVRNGVWVRAGSPLRPLKFVPYVRPVGCAPVAPGYVAPEAPQAAAPADVPAVKPVAKQVSSGGDNSGKSGSNNSGSNSSSGNNSGDLPVTGAGVAGFVGGGLLLAGLGVAGVLFARKRRTSFTA